MTQQPELLSALCSAFEDWLDQQVLPPDIAEYANFVLAYLRMDQPLPAPLRAKLAAHIAALAGTHDTFGQPVVNGGFRQSVPGSLDANSRLERREG